MIRLLERQIQTWDGRGEVWRERIIESIRKRLEARIEKERGKRHERTEGYSNDEDTLRQEVGIDPEVDGLEAACGLGDAGRGHGRRRQQWEQGANLGVLDDVALVQAPADTP